MNPIDVETLPPTNDLGALHPQMCSIVVSAHGTRPFIAAINLPSFGPVMAKAFRYAVKTYLGNGIRIDWSNLAAIRNGCTVKMVANVSIGG